jgi:hypothetical protein
VLLPRATELEEVDERTRQLLTPQKIASIVSLVPDEWLTLVSSAPVTENKDVYEQFLVNRLSLNFINDAEHARKALV